MGQIFQKSDLEQRVELRRFLIVGNIREELVELMEPLLG